MGKQMEQNVPKKKTIWIINHYALTPDQGGLSRHYYFAKELIARGYNVRIFSSSAIHNTNINMIGEQEKCLFKDIDYNQVQYTYIKSSQYSGNGVQRIKNMLGFAYNIRKIWKYYRNEKPDVIYTSSPDLFTAWQAQKLAIKHNIPNIVEIRDLWPLSVVEYNNISNNNPIIKVLYMMEKMIYKKSSALIFTMPGGGDYIQEKGWGNKVRSEKIFNVNNGIDVEEQNRQVVDCQIKDSDLDENGAFKIIYCGSIRKVNNIGKLIDVAECLKNEEDIRFIIYGDGNQKEELEIRCKNNDIHNVKFKGYIDKKYVPYVCHSADINIINVMTSGVSKYGVSWNKLYDYMNAGKPIVSTEKVKYDFIEKYKCGISCENQNTTTVVAAIRYIKNLNKDDYLQMCKNAKEGAKDFDYKVLTDKLEKVIDYALMTKEEK